MIFVTVGTQKFQFNRMLVEIDELVEKGIIKDKIYAQIGYSDYRPKNFEYIEFIDKDKFESMIEESDIILTHSGVGTIISGLKKEKKIIVYPRRAKYKEHVDDHQLQIAKSFYEKNLILVRWDDISLSEVIDDARNHSFNKYISNRANVINIIEKYLLNETNIE